MLRAMPKMPLDPARSQDGVHRARRRSWVVVVASLLVMPLVVLGVWLYGNDRWAPIFDLAMTEVRVRDVGTVHTPLVGLPGRAGRIETPGSHPGPLSFYLLAPVYRMLGGSYWALRVSTAAFQAAAIVCALLIAHRRAGAPAVIAAGVMIALLELGYGLLVLTEPWNPHLPVLWFVVFLLAVWSVACDDPWMLPVAAASASLCAQTHLPYVPVCGGLGVVALLPFAASWAQARRRGVGARGHVRALLTATAVVAVLWLPPAIDEWTREPGNFKVIVDYFSNPPGASVGFPKAIRLTLEHLDPVQLTLDPIADPGLFAKFFRVRVPQAGRGLVLFVLWLAAAAMAVALGNRPLVALHGVVAASLVFGLIAISRIVGPPWQYLMFWGWGIGAAMLVAVVATAALGAGRRMSDRLRMRLAPAGALGIAAIGLCAVRLAAGVDAAGASVPRSAAQLAQLAPDAAAAIHRGVGAATGDPGRYLVTWSDFAQGLGLVDELERRGLHVCVPKEFGPAMTEHRVVDSQKPTARVHLASAGSLDRWRQTPGAIEVALSDPRTAQELEEFGRLRAQVIGALRQQGREDVVAAVDRDFDGVSLEGVSPFIMLLIARMREIGGPAAVFILPARGPMGG